MTAPDRSEFTPGILQQVVSLDGANGQIPLLPSWDQAAAEELLKLLYIQDNPKINNPLDGIFAGLRTGIPLVLAIIEAIVQRLLGGTPVYLTISHALTALTAWWNDLLAILGNPTGIGSGSLDLDAIWSDIIETLITPTGLLATFAEVVDAIFEAILGIPRDSAGDPITDLNNALRNIPIFRILGIGGPADAGSTFQSTWDNLIGGLVGAIGSGAGLADLFNVSQAVSSNAALGGFSWDVLGIRSNKPFWNGLLPTGIANIPLPVHQSTAPTFALTQSTATMSFHHIDEGSAKGVVSWTGSGVTSITDFFINIFRMATDGTMTLVHQSANIIGDVSSALGTNIYTLPTPLAVLPGETYGIEMAIRGAGTHNIVGVQTWLPNHPTVFPRNLAAVRNSGTSAPPSSIASGSVTYSTNVPFVEFAVSGGEFDNHQPALHSYLLVGSHSIPIASWANFVEVIAIGGGGGGRGGQFGGNGEGGDNGAWATNTWVRGTDFTGTPTISITVAAGGAGGASGVSGSTGASSIVSISGHTVTATGGPGGTGSFLADTTGQSPGNQTYSGQVYVGGGSQSSAGGKGAAPGGGGAGGLAVTLGSGGAGAIGAVWIRFRQT